MLCTTDSGLGLATDLVILSLLALSAWLVLRTGRVSLGQQAPFALGAYAAGLATAVAHWPLLPALLLGAATGGLGGALVALPTLRLSGLHYAVATLAFAELLRLGLAAWHFQVREADGTWVGPAGVDGFRDIRWLLEHQVTPEQYLVFAASALLLVLAGLVALGRTRLGMALQAVGLDDTLAAAGGLPVHRLRVLAAALAGAVAALGGGLYAHRVTFIDPAVFDPMLGVHAVGYALIGGLATVAGPLLGASIDLGLLEASRLFEGWRMVVFGGLVALFLRWRPRGLLDEAAVARLAAGWRRRRPPDAAAAVRPA
ncbi:branched amino acid transport system permease [Piscinibacter sakaiensis]|uniref:Branched amino acid transport system permease n=1 Tax=Piscinibacter sakaiensis TaxID=1547922 RepID=A0A0K8NVG1_PISS1|nr:branched amino acid transport system permease [Piscinibacter sakaiensis]